MKTVEIDICTQKQCYLMPTKTEGFTQASTETPCRSPDLLVYNSFIGLYLTCPDLAWFSNLVLDVKNYDKQFQGLIISMCDVTDICMKLKVPPKIS